MSVLILFVIECLKEIELPVLYGLFWAQLGFLHNNDELLSNEDITAVPGSVFILMIGNSVVRAIQFGSDSILDTVDPIFHPAQPIFQYGTLA